LLDPARGTGYGDLPGTEIQGALPALGVVMQGSYNVSGRPNAARTAMDLERDLRSTYGTEPMVALNTGSGGRAASGGGGGAGGAGSTARVRTGLLMRPERTPAHPGTSAAENDACQ
jgi:hypothetical protein